MLGVLLLYFIAKPFYKLAEKYEKNKWLFAVSSIIIYFAGLFIGNIVIAALSEIVFKYSFDKIEDILIGLMELPFGILLAWLYYKFLKKQWENNIEYNQSDILDENINNLS